MCHLIIRLAATSFAFFTFFVACALGFEWTVDPDRLEAPADTSLSILGSDGEQHQIYSASYAVLIIQGDYSGSPWESSKETADRVEDMLTSALVKRGFEVSVWRNLKNRDFRDVVDEVFDNYGQVQRARLFFYYFGHGTTIGLPSDPAQRQLYLVPVDAPAPDDEPAFKRGAFAAAKIVAQAGTMGALHAFFAFEACDAGALLSSLTDPPVVTTNKGYLLSDSLRRIVRQYLAAGTDVQKVPANGSFSATLVEALSTGEADVNKDGYITGREAMNFVTLVKPLQPTLYPNDPQPASVPFPGGDMIFGPIDTSRPPGPIPKDTKDRENSAVVEACLNLTTRKWFEKDPVRNAIVKDFELEKAIPACEKAVKAEPGNGGALDALARAYERSKRYEEAASLYQKASAAGEPGGYEGLGYLTIKGLGVKADEEKGLDLLRRSAEGGSVIGMDTYGDRLVAMNNLEEALGWYRKSADGGFPFGEYHLAEMYRQGKGTPVDDVAAVEHYRKAASAGLPAALFYMGYMYEEGRGVEADLLQAQRYYLMAAEGGSPGGMVSIGRISRDRGEVDSALKWYKKAADEFKRADAMDAIGDIYINRAFEGSDPADFGAAMEWFGKGAGAGDKGSMAALGAGYLFALGGLPQDISLAKEWLTKAVDAGWQYDPGLFTWGTVPLDGATIEPLVEVVRLAAQKGDGQAMYELALYYLLPASHDTDEAISWLTQASDKGIADATDRLQAIYLGTSDEIPMQADYDRAFELTAKVSDRGEGSGASYFSVGYTLSNGDENDDIPEALRWLSRALELGNAGAAFHLADLYSYGRGVERNDSERVRYLEAGLALNNDSGREVELARLLTAGNGVPTDYVRAISLLEKAGDAGYDDLGIIYWYGKGVPVDHKKSKEMFEAGAATGCSECAFHLAGIYPEGFDEEFSAAKKRELYLAAADRGSSAAMGKVAEYLLKGYGGPVDEKGALTWAERGANEFTEDADAALVAARILDGGLGTPPNPNKAGAYFLLWAKSASTGDIEAMIAAFDDWTVDTRQAVQLGLKAAGNYQGMVDGKFGPATLEALLSYSNGRAVP